MKRVKMSRRKDSKIFALTANRVKSINLGRMFARGGVRL